MYLGKPRLNQRGFTMIELMISSAVFAVLLLVVTAGVLSFSRQYYKGIVSTKTQTAARSIMTEIAQSIQFGSNIYTDLDDGGTMLGLCIDNKLFSYKIGQQVKDNGGVAANNQAYHGLVVDSSGSSCSSVTAPAALPNSAGLPTGQRELLGDGMRLAALDISSNGDTYTVRVRVLYGDNDVFSKTVSPATTPEEWPEVACSSSSSATQYCAISDLTTTVQKRL